MQSESLKDWTHPTAKRIAVDAMMKEVPIKFAGQRFTISEKRHIVRGAVEYKREYKPL